MNFEIAPKSTETRLNWFDAKLYCFALDIDGKTGWRLPTMTELNVIYESDNDFDGDFYWTSTTGNLHNSNSSNAWCQDLSSGYQSPSIKSHNGHFVRAVRDLT